MKYYVYYDNYELLSVVIVTSINRIVNLQLQKDGYQTEISFLFPHKIIDNWSNLMLEFFVHSGIEKDERWARGVSPVWVEG